MISKLVTAENKEGVKLGERTINVATSLTELQGMFSEKDILAKFYRSEIIDVQRELRAEAMKGVPTANEKVEKMIAAASAALKAGDSTLYDALVTEGIIESSHPLN